MSDKTRRVLHQFPLSHYCEKTRWHLDHKRLDYELNDVVPGLHFLVLPRASRARSTVPVLVDGDVIVGDSSEIALHLEARYPERPLLPRRDDERARALELEAFFDDEVGPHVRRWVYGLLLRRRGDALTLLLSDYPLAVRVMRPVMSPFFEHELKKIYAIDAESTETSRKKVVAGLERLEQEISDDPHRRLVGDSFGLADLVAASMLAPIVGPPGSTYEKRAVPDEILELRARFADRPSTHWIRERYRVDR